MWRTDNKVYQPILSKTDLLSCLSMVVVLEHEPLLPNRVVNPQHMQSNFLKYLFNYVTGILGNSFEHIYGHSVAVTSSIYFII